MTAEGITNTMGLFSGSILSSSSLMLLLIISLSAGIITVLYFSLLEAFFNQSIGKMIMGIYVVDAKKEKSISPIQFSRSLTRSAALVLDVLFLLDAVSAMFNPEKRRYMERKSDTKTIIVTQV
jgi:uncharacterized RDD family membrane protein YckC